MDSNTVIDRLPLKDLENRYGIPRSLLYKRIKDLGIKSHMVGTKGYLDTAQIKLLDDLDAFLKGGKNRQTPEFLEKLRQSNKQSIEQSRVLDSIDLTQFATNTSVASNGMNAIAESLAEIADRLYILQDPLEPLKIQQERLRMIEEVAEKGWLLPTKHLQQLLGLRSLPGLQDGAFFHRYGFQFVRAGKVGRENEWRITKLQYRTLGSSRETRPRQCPP